MTLTPAKLNPDAIAEAICEVRFETEHSASLPEIIIGKLAEFSEWREFQKIRLPISDIPAPIRAVDPNLRNQPSLELRDADNIRVSKIGANVLSYHRLAPYPGGDVFKTEIRKTLNFVFESFASFKSFRCTRLGFRYINLFTDKHGLKTVTDLHYSVTVAKQPLTTPQNLNYNLIISDSHRAQIRIASPEFVLGPNLSNVAAVVDVDVYTPEGFETRSADDAMQWVENAHTHEKEEFFKLFTDEMNDRLVVKS